MQSSSEQQKSKIFSTINHQKSVNINISLKHRKSLKWSEDEDNKLIELVKVYGNKNWKKISECLETRNPVQCLHRWSKILQPGLVKGPWTVEEDRKLLQWVKSQGAMKWSMCSELIPGRSGKQCRERWYNNLNPEVIKGNWTPREDYMIFKLFSLQGSKWSKIAEHFQGRTENSIKNRFYSTLRRLSSKFNSNNHTGGNLNELLEFFPAALKEKEEELAKEKEELSRVSTNTSTSFSQGNDIKCNDSLSGSPLINSISNQEKNDMNEMNIIKEVVNSNANYSNKDILFTYQQQMQNNPVQYYYAQQNPNLYETNKHLIYNYLCSLNTIDNNYYKFLYSSFFPKQQNQIS